MKSSIFEKLKDKPFKWYYLRWQVSVVSLLTGLIGVATLGFVQPGWQLHFMKNFMDYEDLLYFEKMNKEATV